MLIPGRVQENWFYGADTLSKVHYGYFLKHMKIKKTGFYLLEFKVDAGIIKPWFGQSGKRLQYFLLESIEELLKVEL